MVKEISPINTCNDNCYGGACSPQSLVGINGIFYFFADDGIHGYELWKSNGTVAGTALVKDINPGSNNAFGWEYSFFEVDNKLYFAPDDGTNPFQLWETDGTADGTVRLTDISPNGAVFGYKIIKMNNILFFGASEDNGGGELWALPLVSNPGSGSINVYLPIIMK